MASSREILTVLRAFARELRYTVRVPGTHPSGFTNDELLELLASQGRDFAADSPRLHQHVLYALREQFAQDGRMPGRAQLKQIASAAIVEWVVARFESNLRDVPIKPNVAAYRLRKALTQNYSVPGMRTGALRDAVRDRGRAVIDE